MTNQSACVLLGEQLNGHLLYNSDVHPTQDLKHLILMMNTFNGLSNVGHHSQAPFHSGDVHF